MTCYCGLEIDVGDQTGFCMVVCEVREECNKNDGNETGFGVVMTCESREECSKGGNITRVWRIEGLERLCENDMNVFILDRC